MPPGATILTLDNGTSSTKAALWSLGGQVLAEINLPYTLERPRPTWVEIDAKIWWQTSCQPMTWIEELIRGCIMSYSAAFPGHEWTDSVDAL
jgi:sugar (pentulose or hexulose) kinase